MNSKMDAGINIHKGHNRPKEIVVLYTKGKGGCECQERLHEKDDREHAPAWPVFPSG